MLQIGPWLRISVRSSGSSALLSKHIGDVRPSEYVNMFPKTCARYMVDLMNDAL